MRVVAVGLALALSSAAAWAADEPCRQREPQGTIICENGKRVLRVIFESQSPSGRYAVAWSTVDPKGMQSLEKDSQSDAKRVRYHTDDYENVRTYLVRLSDAKVMKELESNHFGDNDSYNHRGHQSIWSPDGRFLIELTSLKWFAEVASAYIIGPQEIAIGPAALVPPLRQAALSLLKAKADRMLVTKFRPTIRIETVGNDGTFKAWVEFAEPKQDGVGFDVQMRLLPGHNTLAAEVTSIERHKD